MQQKGERKAEERERKHRPHQSTPSQGGPRLVPTRSARFRYTGDSGCGSGDSGRGGDRGSGRRDSCRASVGGDDTGAATVVGGISMLND